MTATPSSLRLRHPRLPTPKAQPIRTPWGLHLQNLPRSRALLTTPLPPPWSRPHYLLPDYHSSLPTGLCASALVSGPHHGSWKILGKYFNRAGFPLLRACRSLPPLEYSQNPCHPRLPALRLPPIEPTSHAPVSLCLLTAFLSMLPLLPPPDQESSLLPG